MNNSEQHWKCMVFENTYSWYDDDDDLKKGM